MPRTKKSAPQEPTVEPVQTTEPNQDIECGVCGKTGGPNVSCGICHGHAPVQSRAYTLSEVRSGRAPENDRYGPNMTVGPKKISLPGSA